MLLLMISADLKRNLMVYFGPSLAVEGLLTKDGVKVSRETLRKWMVEDGLWLSRKQRRSFHQPRLRRESYGELIQIDVMAGRGTVVSAAAVLALGVRQTFRLLARYQEGRRQTSFSSAASFTRIQVQATPSSATSSPPATTTTSLPSCCVTTRPRPATLFHSTRSSSPQGFVRFGAASGFRIDGSPRRGLHSPLP